MPPDVFRDNTPEWGWYIVAYFFLGGIAAGAYFSGALLELFGDPSDRPAIRVAHLLAFPILAVCGILLILDLHRPERFFHMLVQSERPPLPMFKWWSPMSIGSWALLLFSAIAFVSFVDAVRDVSGRRPFVHRGVLGVLWALLGSAAGFFFASYTGVLLATTNYPVWSDSPWVAVLFLASATSTGLAALLLLVPLTGSRAVETWHKLEAADRYAMVLELLLIFVFVATLGVLALPFATSLPGLIWLWVGVVLVGLLVPLALHLRPRLPGAGPAVIASLLSLVGGFILRYVVVMLPQGLFH
jgi:formate-dependent nitrite reductase membrane component NrfD